jgi:hypothetical protein
MSIKVSSPIMALALLFLVTPVLAQSPRVVRWEQGSPGSEQFKREGVVVKRMNAEGVIVEAYIRGTAYGLRVDLKVSNGGPSALDVRPESVAVDLTSPVFKSLAFVPAKNLKHMIKRDAHSRASSKEMSGAWATKTVVETETKYVDETVYGADGPKTERRLVTETKVKTVPDDHARWNAQNEADSIRFAAFGDAFGVERAALKAKALPPGADASGALYFSHDPSAKEVLLRVPLGDLTVEIPFKVVKKRVFLWVKSARFE